MWWMKVLRSLKTLPHVSHWLVAACSWTVWTCLRKLSWVEYTLWQILHLRSSADKDNKASISGSLCLNKWRSIWHHVWNLNSQCGQYRCFIPIKVRAKYQIFRSYPPNKGMDGTHTFPVAFHMKFQLLLRRDVSSGAFVTLQQSLLKVFSLSQRSSFCNTSVIWFNNTGYW